MALFQNIRLLGQVAKLKLEQMRVAREHRAPRIDEKFPLGLQVGGVVNFQPMPFITAGMRGSVIDRPPEIAPIAKIGTLRLNDDLRVLKVYFGGSAAGYMLWVAHRLSSPNSVDEIRLFQTVFEYEPQSGEEWSFFFDDPTKGEPYYIGVSVLRAIELFAARENLNDGTFNEVVYARVWNPGGATLVSPVELHEKVHETGWDQNPNHVHHHAMLYGREVAKPGGTSKINEFFLLSAHENRRDNSGWVEGAVGIDIPEEAITVLPDPGPTA